jgi:metal transporter CNNM
MSTGRSNYNGYAAARPAVLGLAKVLVLGLSQVSAAAALPLIPYVDSLAKGNSEPELDDGSLVLYLVVALCLVLAGGVFAGLTIALMGQDGVYLQVIAQSGEGKEQKHARAVYKLLSKSKHWVLVTLLLANVVVNETLPIVLDRSLGGGWPAVVGSTALIGELDDFSNGSTDTDFL